MADLLHGVDFYERPTPYMVLDVPPDAPAADIRDRYAGLQRDIQEEGASTEARAKEKERIDAAYNQVRVAGNRMRVDFFLIDPQLGLKQAEAIAKGIGPPDTKIEGLVKVRQLKISHAVLTSLLQEFVADPGRVVGMHVRPLELEEPAAGGLPDVLAPQFDC
jgi:hypothetical protein